MLKLTPRKDKAASESDTGSNALDVLQSRNAKVKNDDAFEASTDDAERLITVSIDDIDLYTNNPRRAKNERYDEIKESIRSNGLRNPPDITKAPNSDRYMVANGGNTRLQILKELRDEASADGTAALVEITCRVIPWKSETHIFAAHLTENDKRGDMVFIDMAEAMRDLLKMVSPDKHWADLPSKEVVTLLSNAGWTVNGEKVSRYRSILDYANYCPRYLKRHTLKPENGASAYSPVTMWQTRWIAKTFKQYQTLLKENKDSMTNQSKLRSYWCNTLSRLDGPELDSDESQRELSLNMNQFLVDSFGISKMEIEMRMDSNPVNAATPLPLLAATLSDTGNGDESASGGTATTNTPKQSASAPTTADDLNRLLSQSRNSAKRLADHLGIELAPYAGGIGVLPSMPESPIDLAKELPKAASFSQLYLYLWSSLPFDDERKLRESKDGLCFNLSSAFEGDDSVAQLQIARFLLKLRQPSSLDRDTKKLSQLIATFEGCVSRLIATNVRGNES